MLAFFFQQQQTKMSTRRKKRPAATATMITTLTVIIDTGAPTGWELLSVVSANSGRAREDKNNFKYSPI